MTNQEFDDIIKNKAQQRDAEVPEDIWENIVERKKKRRIPFFWWMFLSLLVAGTGVVWIIHSRAGKSTMALAEKNNTEIQKATQQTAGIDKTENNGAKQTVGSITTASQKTNDSIVAVVAGTKKEKVFTKLQPEINPINTDVLTEKLLESSSRSKSIAVKKAGKSSLKNIGIEHSNEVAEFFPSKQKPVKERKVFKEKDLIEENENMLPVIAKNKQASDPDVVTENIEDNKTAVVAQNNTTDSSQIKTTLLLPEDSTKKKEKPLIAAVAKKKTASHKKPGMKIEFAVSQILPVQQYKQPLQTRRLVTQPDLTSEFVSDKISTRIESGTGFSVGIVKPINKRWSLGAGIQYLQFTELLELSGVETNSDVNSIRKTKTIIEGRNVYYNVTVPVFVHYSFVKQRKWNAALRAGVYLDVSRKYHNDIPGNFENIYITGIQPSASKNNIGADLFAGFHLSGALSKRYEWFAEPAFRYNLSRYNSSTLSFNKKIHKPTISIGLAYQLRR